jgi:hypothetical protein
MIRRFLVPIQYFEIYYIEKSYSPWIISGIFFGFVATGFLLKKYIVKLIRKNM